MDDYISRQAAIEALDEEPDVWSDDGYSYGLRDQWRYDKSAIEAVQSADVRENVHGNWVGIDDDPCETFECDRCGFVLDDWIQGAFYNFCPNCGADMRKEGDKA